MNRCLANLSSTEGPFVRHVFRVLRALSHGNFPFIKFNAGEKPILDFSLAVEKKFIVTRQNEMIVFINGVECEEVQ